MGEERPDRLHALRDRDSEGHARRIGEIRETVRSYLDRVSLRQAAREVGMSPTGLSKFLCGAEPYAPTVRKLETWYDAHVSGDGKADGSDETPPIPDMAAMKAEEEMFAEALEQAFLGVLAERDPEPWYEKAAKRMSRGIARKLLSGINAAHAAGTRQESRAMALAGATELLCERGRKPAGPYDFPTELAVLVVTRAVADAVLRRVDSGIYNSPDEVVGSAMHVMEWAESDPVGKAQLLKLAVSDGVAEDEAGRTIPADVVFARMRERARED